MADPYIAPHANDLHPQSRGRGIILSAGALLLFSASSAALAQGASASATAAAGAPGPNAGARNEAEIEDIVVTASKRVESVLKSPVAVTAVSETKIREAGVVGLADMNAVAPSLQVRNTGSFGAVTFSIRGVSNADIYELANSPVATYVDGIYIGRPDAMGGMVYDIDRIEVLRGPQGTLYGRNSTGGNVNILTAKPEQQFDASADFSYGRFDEVQTRGMVNVPLSPTLAVRAAVALRKNDGIFNTLHSTTRNYGMADEFSARLSSRWEPSDNFRWDLVAEYYKATGTPGLDIETGPDGKPLDGLPIYKRAVDHTEEPGLDTRNLMLRSRMDLDLSANAVLSYIAGYQNVEMRPQTVFGPFTLYRDTPLESTSHEVNLSFDTQRLKSIFGANYYLQDYGADANSGLTPLGLLLFVNSDIRTKAWGAFNQTTFNLSESFRLIGGLRYSSERFDVTNSFANFCLLSDYPPAQFPLRSTLHHQTELAASNPNCLTVPAVFGGKTSGDAKSHKVTWKLGAAYDISDDTSTYATVSTGFKSAGLNLGAAVTEGDARFSPEVVTNYEIGFKTRAFDRKFSLNTALYYMDYKDIQVTQLRSLSDGRLGNVTRNAAGARNYGAEIEWNWQPTEMTEISGFLNYVHATYTNFTNAIDEVTNNVIPSLRGNSLPYAPRWSAQVHAQQDFDLPGGGLITPKATVFWQSKSYIRPINQPIDLIPSYTKVDLTLTYTDPSEHWNIDGFVNNLTDETVRNGGFVYVGSYMSSYNPPRTYGVRVSYRY